MIHQNEVHSCVHTSPKWLIVLHLLFEVAFVECLRGKHRKPNMSSITSKDVAARRDDEENTAILGIIGIRVSNRGLKVRLHPEGKYGR